MNQRTERVAVTLVSRCGSAAPPGSQSASGSLSGDPLLPVEFWDTCYEMAPKVTSRKVMDFPVKLYNASYFYTL